MNAHPKPRLTAAERRFRVLNELSRIRALSEAESRDLQNALQASRFEVVAAPEPTPKREGDIVL